jgi:hypothetical protein
VKVPAYGVFRPYKPTENARRIPKERKEIMMGRTMMGRTTIGEITITK